MSNQTNLTEPVSQDVDDDGSGMTVAEQRKALDAYRRAVEAYQARLVAKINRQAEAYRRQHPDEVA